MKTTDKSILLSIIVGAIVCLYYIHMGHTFWDSFGTGCLVHLGLYAYLVITSACVHIVDHKENVRYEAIRLIKILIDEEQEKKK